MKLQLPEWISLVAKRQLFWIALLLLQWPLCAHAQDSRTVITYEAGTVKAGVVLQAIEKQTGYTLTYNADELNSVTIKKVSWKNVQVQEALNELQQDYGIQYVLTGNNIALKVAPKKVPASKAQPKPGTVSGKVVDEENGDPVTGATISISKIITTSNIDGAFTVSVPKGVYSATVSSVGYGVKNITGIEVKENETFQLNLTLKREKGQLQGVVVTASARKESVASLYTRQKNSPSIGDGISAEQISRTPDKNIGESIKRISGISTLDNKYVVVRGLSERYNQALLNGQQMPSTELNRKQFSFDIIPSNIVDNVVVTKTLTPDMSAEFGGGLVQIETKNIPSENFVSVTAGVSVNDKTNGEDMLSLKRNNNDAYWGNYAAHRNLYGKKNWNSLADIRAYKEANKDNAALTNNWQPYYYGAAPSQNYQLSVGHVFVVSSRRQQKLGLLASVSYRNTQAVQDLMSERFGFESPDLEPMYALRGHQYSFTTNVGGVLGVGFTSQKFKLSWQNVFSRLLDEQVNFGKGRHTVLEENSRAMIEKVQYTGLWQSQLKGEHAIGNKGIKFNWIGNYTSVTRERPDNHIAIWKTVPDTFSLPHNDFTVTNYYPEGLSSGVLRMYTKAVEKNLSWDANVLLPFKLGNTIHSFKTGYSGWHKDRSFYVAMIGDQPGMGATVYNPSLPELFSPELGGGKNFISTFGDDYNRSASLHAAYGMFDNRIGKLRLVWGLRAEYFNMNKANQALDAIVEEIRTSNNNDSLDFSLVYNREKNWKFFPSINITYSITPQLNVRAAYAKSIVRPDLREMAYFREYDFELGGIYSADFLRSTMLDNYDVRLEWYPGAGEVLSASFFYKDIRYPMEIYKYPSLNVFQLKNNFKSHNYGVELEARKSLSFINVPVIKNLTLYGNFTALKSEVTPMEETVNRIQDNKVMPERTIGKEEKRPLMGQSNYMGNAGIYYDDKHLHVTLNYNAVSNRMLVYVMNAVNSQFERPMRTLDGQISYRFMKQQAEIKLNISNLLNESNIVYVNKGKNAEENTAALNGNYSTNFLLYHKYDKVIQSLAPGRTYGISLSYTFK
ncbi:MAG: TonB-dependent receptor [Chitinophagaceae bacterium]